MTKVTGNPNSTIQVGGLFELPEPDPSRPFGCVMEEVGAIVGLSVRFGGEYCPTTFEHLDQGAWP